MKTRPSLLLKLNRLVGCLAIAVVGGVCQAEPAQTAQRFTFTAPASYTMVKQDANTRVWQKTTVENGTNRIHQIVEMATGLNYTNTSGQLVPAKEEIDILPNGTAQAVQGRHQAYFPGDIYSGVITVVTPDGVTMTSRPLGLSYFDGTNSVLIAQLTN